jgi:inner membrane protein
LVAPPLLGLADREIGARRKPFRGQGWAIFALAGMVALWCWRWGEHAQGLVMLENVQVASEPVTRIALEPYPVNPYRWHAILETRDFYQTAEVNTWAPSSPAAIVSDPERDVTYKPAQTPAVEAAKQTPLGRVYLDWGTWAVVRDLGPEPLAAMKPPELPPNRQWTTVEFSDLRFDYSFLATRSQSGRTPLAGWVYIVDGRDDAGEAMGGREQH